MSSRVNRTDPAAFVGVLDDVVRRGRAQGRRVGLLVLSLDEFARFVSSYGYRAGDHLLAVVAKRLCDNVRAQDRVVRIGDSKFAVIIGDPRNQGHLILAANKLSQASRPSMVIDGISINLEPRIGAALTDDECRDAETLLQHADTALLDAVDSGASYALYAPGQGDRIRDLLGMQREIDAGLARGEFETYFQPKVGAVNRTPCGAETLLRWSSPTRGHVLPEEFIALADHSDRIHALTDRVMHSALQQAAAFASAGLDLPFAINTTPSALEHEDFVDAVTHAMKLWEVEPGNLIIEVTETSIMRNPNATFHALSALRSEGALVAIDDFGTGYSSLSYFRELPADELKIDKSFIFDMLEDEGSARIVQTVIDLAHGFGMKVTAEGVETEALADALAQMGCDYLQGFLFARPLRQEELSAWMQARGACPAPDSEAATSD